MTLLGKRGSLFLLPLAVTVVILSVGVSTQDVNCNDGETGYTLPCNTDLDPWKKMRTKIDGLNSDSDASPFSVWARIKYGKEKVATIVNTPEKLSKAAKATAEKLKEKTEEAAEAATEAVEEVAEKAKGAKKWLQKGAKILGALATATQFIGPILDIVLLFAPQSKSPELTAIESGFAKMGAKIDSVSYKLENIQGSLDWNAVVGQLVEFESTVNHVNEKYKQLVEEMKAVDPTQELPLNVKGHIEDLVDAIRNSGDIGSKLQLVENLYKGTSAFTNGKTLLEMFVDAVDNDCSKILPMSNKVISLVKNAQRLQYFYEINQKLVKPDDDKGYPKMVYDMYKDSMMEYSKCTKSAAENAQEQIKINHGNGDALTDIIDEMEPKYDLYNWMTMKETDKEDDYFALIDNTARKLEVELTGLSEDDQKKQRLTMFAIKKSSRTEVEDAVARAQKVLVRLRKADLVQFNITEDWDDSQAFRTRKLKEVRNLFKRDAVLRSLIDQERMTLVMFKEDSSISLAGWHYKSNMEILKITREKTRRYQQEEKYLDFTLGFSFNFRNDRTNFNCVNGIEMDLSFEGSFPYCLCNMGYGGDSCEVSLSDAPTSTLSNSVLKMVEIYKVPGMFDLQDDIRKGTEAIMSQMETNKHQIFSVIKQSGNDVKTTENAILSAQSIMLNKLKADNARVLNGLSGLKEAMDAAFERSRNDMLYQTQEGHKAVIKTISDANKKVTDSIKQLTGKVIENRYFKELKFYIPVYQKKFERAIRFGSHYAEQDFSNYLGSHEQNFHATKEAIKKAMVEGSDSFVVARMQIAMLSGCTADYTEQIRSTWANLMELHLAMNTMEIWDLDFKIRNSDNQHAIAYLEQVKSEVESLAKSDTTLFKQVYSSRSCPGFSLSDLVGGGCAASITYPGQSVPMACSDPNKSLVLGSTALVISEVLCNRDGNWAVNVNELRCVSKCRDAHEGKFYGVGEKRRLPDAPSGYFFADKNGNAISESTCLAPKYTPPQVWIKPERTTSDLMNMKIAPLQIKTDSSIGSGDVIDVQFTDMGIYPSGGVEITFSDPMTLQLKRCTETPITLTNVPSGDEKVWNVYRVFGRVKIECNDVTVANVKLSSCTHGERWVYDRSVDKVIFSASDTASDTFSQKVWNWIDPERTTSHLMNIKATPLQIKTGSALGSRDVIDVQFTDMGVYPSGGVEITFSDPMTLQFKRCTETPITLTNVPAGDDKIWTIYRLHDSVRVECNDVLVSNVLIESCTHSERWVYDRSVDKMIFQNSDTATEFCRLRDDCQKDEDRNGAYYRGNIAMTESGRVCQRWDSQLPNGHVRTPERHPTFDLTENYCRNPDGESAAWCYNGEGTVPRFELCNIPKCSETGDPRSVWSVTKKIDIDECATPDFCGYGGTCTNTQGSFTCTCPAGYNVGDSGKCWDNDECHFGGVGYEKCLVQRNLGACENTNGGYRCTCLAGSYSTSGNNQCVACSCNSNGVTSAVCDGNTGACLCNPNVGGADCGSCKTGYATFPYCTQCAAGYYGYPNCKKCSCTDAGVTAQYCNPHTAQCECKANVVGTSCDRCAPHYKDFPSCVPDVRDGTLSAWGPWTDWIDQGTCGPSYRKGYYQKRTRTRTCDDSTKNIHGRSCQGDNLEDSETRFHTVCKPVTGVFITLYTSFHAGTTADLWMGIKQGDTECETHQPTWDGPDEKDYQITYWRYGNRGCHNTFDTTKPIQIYLNSDSDNSVYITQMGAKIGTVEKTWFASGYKSISDGENQGWWTTTS